MVDFRQAWTRPRLFSRNNWMIEYLRQAMGKIPPGRVFSPLSLARLYAYLQKYSGEINRFRAALVVQMLHIFKESRILIIDHDTHDLRYHIL
jgi:hypothetical protein